MRGLHLEGGQARGFTVIPVTRLHRPSVTIRPGRWENRRHNALVDFAAGVFRHGVRLIAGVRGSANGSNLRRRRLGQSLSARAVESAVCDGDERAAARSDAGSLFADRSALCDEGPAEFRRGPDTADVAAVYPADQFARHQFSHTAGCQLGTDARFLRAGRSRRPASAAAGDGQLRTTDDRLQRQRRLRAPARIATEPTQCRGRRFAAGVSAVRQRGLRCARSAHPQWPEPESDRRGSAKRDRAMGSRRRHTCVLAGE